MTTRRTFLRTAGTFAALFPKALHATPITVPPTGCVTNVVWGTVATGATLIAAAGRVWALAPMWAWEVSRDDPDGESCFDVTVEPAGDPVSDLGWWPVEGPCTDVRPATGEPWSPQPGEEVVVASRWHYGTTRIAIGTVAAVGREDPLAAPVVLAVPWTAGVPGGAVFDAHGRFVAVVTRPSEDREGRLIGPFLDAVPVRNVGSTTPAPPPPSRTRAIGLRIGFARPGHMVVREVDERVADRIAPGDLVKTITARMTDGRIVESGMDASRAPMARRLLAVTEGPVDLVLLRRGSEIRVHVTNPPTAPARAGWI